MVTIRNEPPETPARPRALRAIDAVSTRFPRAFAMLLLVAAVLTLNVSISRSEHEVSAVDEREHIDHLIRGARGELIQGGNELSQETLRELCSRGSEYMDLPPCKPGRLDPAKYAVGGVNVADDRPFYYLVTGPIARLLRAVTPGWESLVTWGRVLGSAWFLVGAYLVLRAGDRLGVARWNVVLALVLVAAVPVQLAADTTVTPDATAFATGATLLLAALWWERTGRGLWLLAVLGIATVLFEPTNALGGLVVVAYFAVRALALARRETDVGRWRTYAVASVVIVVSVTAGLFGWKAVDDRRDPPPAHMYTEEERESAERLDPLRASESSDQSLSVKRVLGGGSLFAMFPPVNEIAAPTDRSTGPNAPWYQAFVFAALFLMVGVLLLAVLRPAPEDRWSALGLATTIALIAGSALMVLARYHLYGAYDPVVPRLGLSALPAVALVLAAAARERVGRGILFVVATGLYATALFTLA